MKEFAEGFYKSKRWQECRDAYALSVGGLCERCNRIGLIVPGEIVHHKIYLNPQNIGDANVTLAWSNLELLCRECHTEEHHRKGERRFKFDENGNLIIKDV